MKLFISGIQSRVEIFSRFTVIFLRSPVIPLIRPLIFSEPLMRRYRRISAANWGWPLLIFKRKPLFSPISHKKAPVKFFDTDAEKVVPNRKTRFSPPPPKKKTKTLQCFLFPNGGYRTPKSSLRKVRKKVEKSSFIQKIDIRFRHLQLYLW